MGEGCIAPGGVDADEPVRSGTAQRRLIKRIKLAAVAQILKTLPNGLILHAVDPEPFYALVTFGVVVDQTEDQLALPSCVRGADHRGHRRVVHQPDQQFQLPTFVFVRDKLPALRQNGQILHAPVVQLRVDLVRFRRSEQVTIAPAHHPAVSFHVSIPFIRCAKHLGKGSALTGLFRNDQLHPI